MRRPRARTRTRTMGFEEENRFYWMRMNISDSGLTRILVIRNSASSLPASFVGRAREASPVPTAEGSDGCGGRQAAFFPGAKFSK
ncbi:hypothetical protein BHE74_00038423 [Ensete ventricosum]|nr:hypothetical protein BHE74_00038423 [Ensete ventricosum]